MDDKPVVAAATPDGLAEIDSGGSPAPAEAPVARGIWTRDVEALCRALDAQQRAHFPRSDAKDQ